MPAGETVRAWVPYPRAVPGQQENVRYVSSVPAQHTLAPESTSSLQRDVMEGKMSELDAQLGTVVRLAREAGVPTPVNDVLYACLVGATCHTIPSQ